MIKIRLVVVNNKYPSRLVGGDEPTHLVVGDGQLGLTGLPGTVTVGDSSSSIRRSTLDPVNDGETGVGVSAEVEELSLSLSVCGLKGRQGGKVWGFAWLTEGRKRFRGARRRGPWLKP